MNNGLKRGAILLVALAALGGCSNSVSTNSEIEQGPVGIGRGVNELKGTPCACTEIPMTFPEQMSV